MSDPTQVPCPSCTKPLYKQGPIDFAASIFGKADDFPTVIARGEAAYLKCRHCSMFVLMQPATAPARGFGFEIHPSRKFFDKIPG